jgi:hypothetical protein
MRKLAITLLGFGALAMGGCATTASAPSWRPTEARITKPDESHDLDDVAGQVMVAARDPQPSSRRSSVDPASPAAFDIDPGNRPARRVAARRVAKRRR